MVDNLVVNQVELDGVVGLDDWVRVTDGSSVVGKEVRNSLLSERVGLDLQELEGSLLGGDSVDGESSLDVVKETEVLSDLSIVMTSMKPVGKVSSVLTFPSTLMVLWAMMAVTSRPVKAYLRRFRRKMVRGRDSRSL